MLYLLIMFLIASLWAFFLSIPALGFGFLLAGGYIYGRIQRAQGFTEGVESGAAGARLTQLDHRREIFRLSPDQAATRLLNDVLYGNPEATLYTSGVALKWLVQTTQQLALQARRIQLPKPPKRTVIRQITVTRPR